MRNWKTYGTASIVNGDLSFDGIRVFNATDPSFEPSIGEIYDFLSVAYPKFFKMDRVSKLALLLSELLLTKLDGIKNVPKEEVAICLQTAHGCLDTDLRYLQTLDATHYFPSPSLFVYTLPNIAMGEICIRHGFKGENICLISEQFDWDPVQHLISDWFESTGTTLCLVGWLEVLDEKYEGFLMAIGPENQKTELNVPQKNSNG